MTRIIETAKGHVLIFADDEVFSTGLDLKKWRKFARLGLRYRPGRPDAVSSYPAVHAIHMANADPSRLVLATARDGYVELDRSGLQSHALPTTRLPDTCSRASGAGLLASDSAADERPSNGRPPPLPVELAKQLGIAKQGPFWADSIWYARPDGAALVVASGDSDGRGEGAGPPFPLVVARWDGATLRAVGRTLG